MTCLALKCLDSDSGRNVKERLKEVFARVQVNLTNTLVINIQGVFESCAEILTTSYWLHVELGKNIFKNSVKK
jgi:CMP-2-keto-3-deoxyoctulosonic acid synthetase